MLPLLSGHMDIVSVTVSLPAHSSVHVYVCMCAVQSNFFLPHHHDLFCEMELLTRKYNFFF